MMTLAPRATHQLAALDKRRVAEVLRGLHPMQVTIYQAIRSRIMSDGAPPMVRELSVDAATSQTNVRYHLRRLEHAGLIWLLPRQQRGIRLVPVIEPPKADGPKRTRTKASA